MTILYSVEKTSFTNKKFVTVYYSCTGKFIKTRYHRALMPLRLAEEVAAEHKGIIEPYFYKHQH